MSGVAEPAAIWWCAEPGRTDRTGTGNPAGPSVSTPRSSPEMSVQPEHGQCPHGSLSACELPIAVNNRERPRSDGALRVRAFGSLRVNEGEDVLDPVLRVANIHAVARARYEADALPAG